MKNLMTFEEYESTRWARELRKKLEEISNNLKRPIVDPNTGNIEGLKYDPTFVTQDYFIPSRDINQFDWRTTKYVHTRRFVVPITGIPLV